MTAMDSLGDLFDDLEQCVIEHNPRLDGTNTLRIALEAVIDSSELKIDGAEIGLDGRTLLSKAAEFGYISLMQCFLGRFHDRDTPRRTVRDADGRTPLSWAAVKGNVEMMRFILETGFGETWNVMDYEGHNPLWWAVTSGAPNEFVQMLIPHDKNETLHTLIREDKQNEGLKLIGAGYDINETDHLGQTALISAVRLRRRILAEALINHSDTQLDRTDRDGLRALNIACHNRDTDLVRALFLNSASTEGISVEEVFDAFQVDHEHGLLLSEAGTGWEIDFVKNPEFPEETTKLRNHKSFIIMRARPQTYAKHPAPIQDTPYAFFLSKVSRDQQEQANRPHLLQASAFLDPNEYVSDNFIQVRPGDFAQRIAWTVQCEMVHNAPQWNCFEYFSNLKSLRIPGDSTELLVGFLEDLTEKWMWLCDGADERLSDRRLEQLIAKGNSTKLIEDLATDALKWAKLRKYLRQQVTRTLEFAQNYCRVYKNGFGAKDIESIIRRLDESVTTRLDKLDQTVRDLLQVEFAWASIQEAHKSTSISMSMKRLSWITFIFLPLTFSASLFGMNVNILNNNPDWRWYVAFAGGTLLLTVIGWLTFKYNPQIESQLESATERTIQKLKASLQRQDNTRQNGTLPI